MVVFSFLLGFLVCISLIFLKKTKFDKTQKSQFWDKNGWESPLKLIVLLTLNYIYKAGMGRAIFS